MSDTELDELRAEVMRLRDLLEEHGIDPEPYVPPPPRYGPPTLLEHMTVLAMNDVAQRFSDDMMKIDKIYSSYGRILRVRLPSDYVVRSN